jgi:hypothetical protein
MSAALENPFCKSLGEAQPPFHVFFLPAEHPLERVRSGLKTDLQGGTAA